MGQSCEEFGSISMSSDDSIHTEQASIAHPLQVCLVRVHTEGTVHMKDHSGAQHKRISGHSHDNAHALFHSLIEQRSIRFRTKC